MKKIYLVDDDMDIVEAMTTVLESRGYEIRSQLNGDDLVDNIRSFNPDLIILDVMFPGDEGAGFKMARTIRHHDDIKSKPILMLSAVNDEGNFVGKFSNKDIDDVYIPVTEFCEKPIKPDSLIAKVESLTG